MNEHQLKVHPQFWDGLSNGTKPFEVRRNDRDFKVGDKCEFMRYDPKVGLTGERCQRIITYLLYPEDFPQGVPVGFVVMGIVPVDVKTYFIAWNGDRTEGFVTDDGHDIETAFNNSSPPLSLPSSLAEYFFEAYGGERQPEEVLIAPVNVLSFDPPSDED